MALGGAFSLADRRLRFGAPARAKSAAAAAAVAGALTMKTLRAALVFALAARRRRRRARGAARRSPAPTPRSKRAPATLSSELRCLVCQNESIDDSDAPLAHDIRVLIRERIAKGESNDAVRAFLVSRYGDFILLEAAVRARDAAAVAERAADAGARRAGDLGGDAPPAPAHARR